MKKPQVRTKKYLDWVEIRPYLKERYPDLKLDKVIGLLAEYGDFCNGCFKTIEKSDPADGFYEKEIAELSQALFSEFPNASENGHDIELYIWW